MKIRVSTRGRIVLPAEIRRRDRILAGDEFEVERLHAGRHRLLRAFRLQINRSSHRTTAYAEKRPFAARFAEIAIREGPAGLHGRPGGAEDLRNPGGGQAAHSRTAPSRPSDSRASHRESVPGDAHFAPPSDSGYANNARA